MQIEFFTQIAFLSLFVWIIFQLKLIFFIYYNGVQNALSLVTEDHIFGCIRLYTVVKGEID